VSKISKTFQNRFQRRACWKACKSRERENPPFSSGFSVERTGIEPVTSGLQSRRSPS
jgi:hypothetical protein